MGRRTHGVVLRHCDPNQRKQDDPNWPSPDFEPLLCDIVFSTRWRHLNHQRVNAIESSRQQRCRYEIEKVIAYGTLQG
jgi:hypothetical protein